jgi:hypothetical protein
MGKIYSIKLRINKEKFNKYCDLQFTLGFFAPSIPSLRPQFYARA